MKKSKSKCMTAPDSVLPCTQGIGIMSLAKAFVDAGTRLNSTEDEISSVKYYLYCHGIELLLKAFLVSQGITEKELRRIGHDIIAALEAANRYEIFKEVSISESDIKIIEWINSYYKEKEFEYLKVGLKRYPHPQEIQKLIDRLFGKVGPLINTTVYRLVRGIN